MCKRVCLLGLGGCVLVLLVGTVILGSGCCSANILQYCARGAIMRSVRSGYVAHGEGVVGGKVGRRKQGPDQEGP